MDNTSPAPSTGATGTSAPPAAPPAALAAARAAAIGPPAEGTLYVLDTHGMIFQMFHGVGPMSSPDGRPTNAVFGVTRAIMDLYDHGADYLLAAFDRAEPTFREAMYTEYKAHRDPPPADLLVQEPMIAQVLAAMRIPVLSVAGFEADDVMATLAREGEARNLNVHLCTSDKDCRQLLTERVKILNLRKGEAMDAKGLVEDWGVTPSQVVDYQALVGDSADNVPGVPGCGPKTAAKWLQKYGTLEGIIAHAEELTGPKLRDNFKAVVADGKLDLSRRLVKLDAHVPLAIDWQGWKRREWDGPRLLELFAEFGFRGFANKVRSTLSKSGAAKNEAILTAADLEGSSASLTTPEAGPGGFGGRSRLQRGAVPSPPPAPRGGGRSLFDAIDDAPATAPPASEFAPPFTRDDGAFDFNFGANASPDGWKADYATIDTPKEFKAFVKKLSAARRIAFDLETTAIDPLRAEIVGYSFSFEEGVGYYVPVRAPEGSRVIDPAEAVAALKPVFENAHIKKANQNVKYDVLVLRCVGIHVVGIDGDSMVADYLLHAGERSHNLDEITRRYLKHENTPISDLIGKGKAQLTMDMVPVEKVRDYACEDADAAFRLVQILEAELETEGLFKLYQDLEVPLIDVLAEMEYNGVLIDTENLRKLSGEMDLTLRQVEGEVQTLAGRDFNLASPKQLREILFDEMRLPVQKRTGTTSEPSTDQESLEKLAALGHELPKKIIEHRQIAKLKGTYVDALPELVNPRTGRVHTSFNQVVTSTGRLSSSDPNLQNIPSRTDQGRQIRQAFVPPPGYKILTADYSQIELRLLAHFCGDAQLIAAFADDRDIHASVAAEIFKVPEGEVTKVQRRVAKTVNFGVIYGISAHGLAVRIGTPRKEAEQFIDAYFAKFNTVLAYQDELLARARKLGYVATILGRRRRFDQTALGRRGGGYQSRTTAEREAINMEIQGSAADLMKVAMLNVHKSLAASGLKGKMLLSVHDELVFETPPEEVAPLAELVRREMVGAMPVQGAAQSRCRGRGELAGCRGCLAPCSASSAASAPANRPPRACSSGGAALPSIATSWGTRRSLIRRCGRRWSRASGPGFSASPARSTAGRWAESCSPRPSRARPWNQSCSRRFGPRPSMNSRGWPATRRRGFGFSTRRCCWRPVGTPPAAKSSTSTPTPTSAPRGFSPATAGT